MNPHQLVRQAFGALQTLLGFIWRPLAALFGFFFGRMAWQPPAWAGWLKGKLLPVARWAREKAAFAALAAALLLGGVAVAVNGPAGGWKNWLAWQSLSGAKPDGDGPARLKVTVQPPGLTNYNGDGQPRPAVLVFSAAAAPLALVGKETKEVTLSPAIAGKWQWLSAERLQFQPDADWPIGEKFTVTLGAKALAPHVRAGEKHEFSSPAFQASFRSATFYQDPVQPSLRNGFFEVDFTHPVNVESFEKRLALEYPQAGASGKPVRFTVTYDKPRLKAMVNSETLPIPSEDQPMTLRLAAGVTAQAGGKGTAGEAVRTLNIPGLFSLDITELQQLIVTADNGEPEHVLQVTAGMAVAEKEMGRAVAAWLLPAQPPEGKEAWDDPAEVTDEVLKRAKKVSLNLLPGELEINESHAFKFAAEAGRYLFVRIGKGLQSAGGYKLASTRDEILRVKRSMPELAIMSKGSLLALSGEKKLPVVVRDLPGVKVEIGRLLPQQLQHLVTQSQGDMSQPGFHNGITPDNLAERFEKKIPLHLKPGKSHYQTVDFADYLKADAADRRGIFLLSVQGYDPAAEKEREKNGGAEAAEYDTAANDRRNPESEGEGEGMESEGDGDKVDPARMKDRRLVIVTDLGLVAKLAVDGSRDVFVQSLASGQPVAEAAVEIWARNGSVLVSQTTDAGGHVRLPSVKGMVREKMPVALVVKKGGDLSFLPIHRADRNLDVSRFDVGGVRASALPNQIQAYLFSDRGIYRPGDAMNIGIIAKSANWGQKLADLPVEVEVVDARGLTVRREKIRLGAGGLAEFSHTTQDTSPTGNYTIHLNLPRDTGATAPGAAEASPQRLGSVTVKVQEFLPDRMKVSARLSADNEGGWVHPQDLKALVDVHNLFGAPAPNRRVEGEMTLTPAIPAFRAYADYVFADPKRAKERFSNPLEKLATNDHGHTEFDLGLQRYEEATYRLHVLVKAFEPEGGRSVAAEAAALVSDRPWLVGHKADGDLGYVSKNGVRAVHFIAIDPKAKKTAVSGLKLVRIERKVVSVLMKQSNGLYKYESRPKETVLKEEAFQLPAAGAKVTLPTATPGNFALALKDEDDLEVARVNYSVAGSGNVSRSLDRNAELQLTLNKKDYQPGEEIELSIRAPYAGAGLITIERDKVYAHQWFVAKDSASVQKITLPKDFEGNGYVSVQFARDIGSNEIYMSPLSYGVAPFATSLARRTNPITLTAPELVKPGQTAKFRLESKTPSKAVVFAVDEGILQVARYANPDPLKHFFQKRALEVGTQQTLDLILPEFKKLMQSAPGGDDEGEAGKHLNPFKRRTDKPVVFWSGIVDVNGSREFSYLVPENFNGALRVLAVTVNDEAVAAAAAKTISRGDIVLLPNVPVALSPGDEVDIGLGVANQTKGSGKDAPVALNLTLSPGLEVVGPASQSLKISERAEGATRFRIRAKEGDGAQLGSAAVTITAQVGNATARLTTDVSVRPASAYVTLAQSGMFRGDASLASQGDFYLERQKSELAISTSPWAFSEGLLQFLEVYPHGCTEQITSQILPAILLSSRPEVAERLQRTAKNARAPDPKKSFERYLALVRARQSEDGGISLWPGGRPDLFATTYVVELLVEAKEREFAVPSDLLRRANLYLQGQLASPSENDHQWRVQAQAAYLLTRQGIATQAILAGLQEALRRMGEARDDKGRAALRRDLGAVYLAASFQMVKQEKPAQALLQPALEHFAAQAGDLRRDWSWRYYYDPLVHQGALLTLVARHFPARIQTLPPEFWNRMAQAIQENYAQTLSAARLVQAIDAYGAAAAQSADGKVLVSAVNKAGVAKALELPQQLALARLAVPPDAARLQLKNGGNLPLFYGWGQSGYERNLPAAAAVKGLEIVREFLDAKGNPVTQAALGEEVTVRLRVRATERQHVDQVALVDILPGGLEPVLTAPGDDDAPDTPLWRRRLGGKSSWAIDYADIREDRVIFYGNVGNAMTEVTYKACAASAGDFVTPAAYGEAMYERYLQGRSAAARFKVLPGK